MNQEYESRQFTGLDLVETSVSCCDFTDCEFVDCTFENVQVVSCSFLDCIFTNCRFINVSGQRSIMRSSQFSACYLATVNWNHWSSGSNFYDPFTSFKKCHLKYNQFTEMNLNKFDFSGCEIVDSLFGDCKLASSSFKGCKLEKTEFFRCDLSKTDFRDATGYRIDILTTKLKGARFSFPEVVNLLSSLGIKIE